uniref:Uncharacterized protein n=1 Tax=Ignisphaera aggregans TaxID=334771 RepID=A0A7C4BEG8_9CREN
MMSAQPRRPRCSKREYSHGPEGCSRGSGPLARGLNPRSGGMQPQTSALLGTLAPQSGEEVRPPSRPFLQEADPTRGRECSEKSLKTFATL